MSDKLRNLTPIVGWLAPVWLLLALAGMASAADEPAPDKTSSDQPAAEQSPAEPASRQGARTVGVLLYPGFELLDACGPIEMFANVPGKMKVITVAQAAGDVKSTQGTSLKADYSFEDCPQIDLLLVPGGFGTLRELNNDVLLDWLRQRAAQAEIVSSVCSGSALLAKAGLLDGRRATSNKVYFEMAVAQGPKVNWVKAARWVDDGDRVTSSGVSVGIDMALHLIARLHGEPMAEKIANATEYQWHRDADNDPFAKFAK